MLQVYPVESFLLVKVNDFVQLVAFARTDPVKISSDVIGPVLHVIQSVKKDFQLLNGPLRLALDP